MSRSPPGKNARGGLQLLPTASAPILSADHAYITVPPLDFSEFPSLGGVPAGFIDHYGPSAPHGTYWEEDGMYVAANGEEGPGGVAVVEEEGTMTSTQTTFNTINLLVGVGVLATPYAFKAGGLVITTGVLLVLSLISVYTARLIKACLDTNPATLRSYPDLAYHAFGHLGRVVITTIFCCEIFTAQVMYVVLLGDNLYSITPALNRQTYMMLSAVVFLPQALTRNLGWLSYLSMLGVFTSTVLLVAILYTGIHEGTLVHPSDSVELFAPSTSPMAIGLVMVGLAGHACFPSMHLQMKNKRQFNAVIATTYSVVFTLYLTIGVCGYLMFGALTSKEISLNLKGSVAGAIAAAVVVVNPLAKFGLTVNPVAVVLEDALGLSNPRCKSKSEPSSTRDCVALPLSLALRAVMTVCAIIIAIQVPHFDKLLGVCGSAFSFTMSIIFPIAVYTRVFWNQMSWMSIVFHLMIFVVAVGFAASGTWAAVMIPPVPI